jgi:hypothetical protein
MFYRDFRAADGRQCKCRGCHKADSVTRQRANPEAHMMAQRRYVAKSKPATTERRFGARENATLVARVWSGAALASVAKGV